MSIQQLEYFRTGFNNLGIDKNRVLYWSMDNEIEIWNSTHDDVMPVQIAAGDYIQQYIAVAKKARELFPEIKLADPFRLTNGNGMPTMVKRLITREPIMFGLNILSNVLPMNKRVPEYGCSIYWIFIFIPANPEQKILCRDTGFISINHIIIREQTV
ncbi:MAG: hypothetical protein HC905_29655 [Bacteroidales bacterium]|nr:hypothetical protein [Bacteroidales bacterium]